MDYISFVGFMTSYLSGLFSMTSENEEHTTDTHTAISLMLGGYSYGSLIVTHLPPLEEMLSLFRHTEPSTTASEIVQKAQQSAGDTSSGFPREMHTSPGTVDWRHFKVQYLLISPLLPPTSFFLSPSLGSVFSSLGRSTEPIKDATLISNPTLAVFGSDDLFTSGSKLQTWSRKMQTDSRGLFEWLEVDGAGHFWREHGVEDEMRERIARWISV